MKIMEIAESALLTIWYIGTERDLQENLNIWITALKKRNMEMNTENTKIMTIGKDSGKIKIYVYKWLSIYIFFDF